MPAKIFRSSYPELFLGKGVLKICSKFTVEHPCQSVISVKLLCSSIEITLWRGCSPVKLLYISRTTFTKNNSGRLSLNIISRGRNLTCLKGTNIFSNNLWEFLLWNIFPSEDVFEWKELNKFLQHGWNFYFVFHYGKVHGKLLGEINRSFKRWVVITKRISLHSIIQTLVL